MRIRVDIHREFEETAAFRSLVAKRETSSVNGRDGYCGLQHAIHGEEEDGEHHQSVRRGGVGAEKIRFPLFFPSFLPANGTKAQKSIYPWNGKRAGVRVTGQV